MAPTRIACPQCVATLKSPSGFTEGDSICCPKCETWFTVEDPTEERGEAEDTPRKKRVRVVADDEGDDYQPKKKQKKKKKASQSYKNSPFRYAVLGVLVIAMLVLGVFLILKKTREAKEQARANADSSPEETRTSGPQPEQASQKKTPEPQPQQFPPANVPQGSVPANDPGAEVVKAQLIGKWVSFSYDPSTETEIMTIEYKNNDEFICTITDKAKKESKVYKGKWKVYFVMADEPGMKPNSLWLGFLIDVPGSTQAFSQLSVYFQDMETIDQIALEPNNRTGNGTIHRLKKRKE